MRENICTFDGVDIGFWRHHGKGVWFTAWQAVPPWGAFNGYHASLLCLYRELMRVPSSARHQRFDTDSYFFLPAERLKAEIRLSEAGRVVSRAPLKIQEKHR